MSETPKVNKLFINLGDIIEIISPRDETLNKKKYLVEYIDKTKMRLVNESGNKRTILIDNGNLINESIEEINILSRSKEIGYARQNNLLPGTWIDVFFLGDLPMIITGKITNLDEDQIEIKIYENGEIIYIDFGYKGLPDELPIEKIVLRSAPTTKASKEEEKEEEKKEEEEEKKEEEKETKEIEGEEIEEEDEEKEEEVLSKQLKDVLLDADDILIGEELDVVSQQIDVPEALRRYGIDNQANDLLDELLSKIPNNKRTKNVMNNIHKIITRFKELRTIYSNYDDINNDYILKTKEENYKPLVNTIENLNEKLHWILPITKNKKKLYDTEIDFDEESDVIPLSLAEVVTEETNIINNYKENDIPDGENKYIYFLKSINKLYTPYENVYDNVILNKRVNTNLISVVDNLEDMYSSSISDNEVKKKRFYLQNHIKGYNIIDVSKKLGGGEVTNVKKVTENDELSIKGLLTLPKPIINFSKINLPSTNILERSELNMNYIQYWKLLNKSTILSSHLIDNNISNDDIEYDYLNKISEYTFVESIDTPENNITYKEFLKKVIPTTKKILELEKENIKGLYSIDRILQYLEPYMIYNDDLTNESYKILTEYINNEIKDYKINYITNLRNKNLIKNSEKRGETILSLIKSQEILDSVKKFYKLIDKNLTNDEILIRMNSIDNKKYYNNLIAYENIDLMLTSKIDDDYIEEKLRNIDEN